MDKEMKTLYTNYLIIFLLLFLIWVVYNNIRLEQKANGSHKGDIDGEDGVLYEGPEAERLGDPTINLSEKIGTITIEGEKLVIEGYKLSTLKYILVWILTIASGGLLALFFHWYRHYRLFSTHSRCSLQEADTVLITETYKEQAKRHFIKKVYIKTIDTARKNFQDHEDCASADSLCKPRVDGSFFDTSVIRYFDVKKSRFLWSYEERKFVALTGLDAGLPLTYYHEAQSGLDPVQQWKRRMLYGINFIRVPVDSYWKLFAMEFLSPFYMFQIFSVFIWIVIEYYYFSGAIVIMAGLGLVVSIRQIKENQLRLRDTIQNADFVDVVLKDKTSKRVGTESLVPGDIIIIPSSGCTLQCDAILLQGTAIVNESTLTGESVPLMKTALPKRGDIMYLEKEHNRHTLYCGTKVIQARYFEGEEVLACVIRTGYATTKGKLVASILYPAPVDFQFERDSYKFIAILAVVSVFGIIFNLYRLLAMGERGWKVFGHTFDIVTITVPPALPAAMTIGSYYAAKRLKKKNVLCISPRTINVGGSLDLFCFDKTGTLTEDGMDFWGVLPSLVGKFIYEIRSAKDIVAAMRGDSVDSPRPPLLLEGMATCHSLTYIDGELCGDPLELKVFEASGWQYEELSSDETTTYDMLVSAVIKCPWNGNRKSMLNEVGEQPELVNKMTTEHVVGIVKNFPFSSSLQRSSVVTKVLGESTFDFYCKGSPEMIFQLCGPESVPSNFHESLSHYTKQGLRVIGIAHRTVKGSILKVERMQREDLEKDLSFLGFIVMENRLKSDTKEVLGTLASAGVRTVMITGDNLDTAISVSRECGMIPSHERIVEVRSICTQDGSASDQIEFSHSSQDAPRGEGEGFIAVNMEEDQARYHLAIDGKTFEIMKRKYPEQLPRIYARGTVFARMKPDQKQLIVQGMQDLGYCVGMCGDGANDCGALKAAHAGISLTETEASVASPFTSKSASISCVPLLIRECRCALVTAFGIFKYMAGYSLIQFVSVMILYDIGTNLTDWQFLYIDLFLITLSSAVFGLTEAYQGPLFHKSPPTSLMAVGPVASIIAQLVLALGTIFTSLTLTKGLDEYVPYKQKPNISEMGFLEGPLESLEGYAVFVPSQFMYIFLAVTFCKGYPFRKRFFTNVPFTLAIFFATVLSVYITLCPAEWLKELMELELPENFEFRCIILALGFGHVLLSLIIETYLVDSLLSKVSLWWVGFRRGYGKKYEAVSTEMDSDLNWLPNRLTKKKIEPNGELELRPM